MSIRTITFTLVVILFGSPAPASSGSFDLVTAENYLERGRILYESSDYDSLPYYYLTAKAIFQQFDRPDRVAECFLGMSDYYRLKLKFDISAATLDSADKYIEEHLGLESESRADALIGRAKLLIDRSQYNEAIKFLNQGLNLFEVLNVAPGKIARTKYLLGTSYLYKGDLEKAQDYYLEVYDLYQQVGAGPSAEMGWLLYNIAYLQNRLGNQQLWKEYISRYIANVVAIYGPDHPDLAKSYSSLTSYFIANGMSDSALYYLEKSVELVKNVSNEGDRDLITSYIQRARIFQLEGNYYRALEYYQQALGILQKNDDTMGFLGRTLYLNMGIMYKSLEEYGSAEKVLLNLLEIEGTVHPTIMAIYYYYLADINRLLGDYNQSEEYFRKVFEINDQYIPEDFYTRGAHYLGFGILLDSLEMYERANDYFQTAVRIIQDNFGFHHLRTARILKSTGDHFYLTGDHDKALDYYQQSILSMDPEYDVDRFSFNPPPGQISDNLFYLRLLKSKAGVLNDLAGTTGDKEDKWQKMTAVYSAYQTSISIIDLLRNSYLSDRSKFYLSGNERDTYEKCVESAYRCYELSLDPAFLNHAFMVAEKGKYATLLSVMQREETIALAGIPDSIVEKDANLRKELSIKQELLLFSEEDSLYDTSKIQRYQAQIFQLRARIESLNKDLERDFPGYYDLLYNQQALEPDMLRRKLKSREMLLEYFYTEKYIYRFAISRKGIQCQKIDHGDEFNRDLDVVENYLSGNFLSDTISHDEFLKTAHTLYKTLIPDRSGHSRMVIIPEGRLSYFPFDILVSEPVMDFSGQYRDVPFMIRDCSIRYGYSATLLDRLENTGRIRLDKLIAFAPGYGKTSGMLASSGEFRDIPIDRTSLRPLPYSIKEVEEIGKISGGKAYTDTMASEGRFKQLAGGSHLIHLAAHAFLDDDDPLKSKLVFSEGNVQEDGFLNVYEIYNLDLAARMVVLSACNTGTGMMKNGEGIMSLARAFIYAGVPNIVMTLWTVSDRQSYTLMLGFYRNLISGRSTETSLRNAKLEFLDQATPTYQHPQYWAGYILVGNPDTLFLSSLYKWVIPLMLVFLIGIPGFIIIRRRIVRKRG